MPIRDRHPSGKFPPITLALILANVYFFIMELLAEDLNLFIGQYALIPSQVNFSNFLSLTPFMSSMFLHGGFLHLFSNMLFLWIFGDNVEAKLGKVKYILLYFYSGVVASLAQILVIGMSDVPMLGASGAIAGVMGAYLVMFPKAQIDMLIPTGFLIPLIIAVPAQFMLIYWFFTQLFGGAGSLVTQTVSVGGVAFWAHIGGFIAGYSGIKVFKRNKA